MSPVETVENLAEALENEENLAVDQLEESAETEEETEEEETEEEELGEDEEEAAGEAE